MKLIDTAEIYGHGAAERLIGEALGDRRDELFLVSKAHPATPDGRYFVVRGRLWRRADPSLPEEWRASLVARLMRARRAVREALRQDDLAALTAARIEVNQAKIALGERGPVWWRDGAPDLNRHMAANTIYAEWFANGSRRGDRRPPT